MNFLAPLGFAAALAAVPLVLWYLLRPRRTRVAVSSTYLWRQIDRPATAAAPWQRFRPDLTFWLALLALVALVLAIARPAVTVPVELGDHTILVIDANGSMLADEDGISRAELARRAATELTSAMGEGQVVSVIGAGPRASIEVATSSEPSEIRRALANIAPTHAPSDLVDAFTLATSLQRPGQHTVTHLLTDRPIPADALAVAPPNLAVTGVGTERNNIAITRLTATPLGGGDHQVLAQVRSFSLTAAEVTVELGIDGQVVVDQPLRLAPRATEDVLLTVPSTGLDTQVLTARLSVDEDITGKVPDALALDNTATALLTPPQEASVLLVGPANRFLENAFAAIEGISVERAEKVPASLDGIDLLVVDRAPAPATLTVPTLLIAPTTWPDGFTPVGTKERPGLTSQQGDHPILADVDLTGVAIAEVTDLDAPAMTALAESPNVALLLAGRANGVPAVAVPFELQQSDLALRTAWPLLLSNITSWALGGEATGVPVPAGTVVIPDAAGANRLAIHSPDGTSNQVTVPSTGAPAVLVDQVGMWRMEPVVTDDGDGTDGEEAGDQPRETFLPVLTAAAVSDVAATPPDATRVETTDDGTTSGGTGLAEIAWMLALGALVLLVLEWLWSQFLAPRRRAKRTRVGRRRATT